VRVALLTYSTRPRGGVVHTLALAEALAARGHDVTVWSLARGGDSSFFRPVDPRVTLRLVPFADVAGETVGERIARSIACLAAAFDPAGADVVHAQDCITANAVPRCVRTVHHLDAFTTPELVRCHEQAIVRPYAHVCVSASVAREVEQGWGIRPRVISNGIDAARFAAPDRADIAAWTAQLGRFVLSVGGIEPRKGTLDLVRAMALVRQADPGLRVLGPVDHGLLPALVAAAEVFAFPSTKEGFGLAAMEALAAGVPVVMRDLPVLREVFAGAAAFAGSVPALAEQLLAARVPDADRAAAGRRLAASYTWEAAAQAHEELYAELLAAGSRSPV
jgi:glycosyltransferase involved in cell wall biosynthesis